MVKLNKANQKAEEKELHVNFLSSQMQYKQYEYSIGSEKDIYGAFVNANTQHIPYHAYKPEMHTKRN